MERRGGLTLGSFFQSARQDQSGFSLSGDFISPYFFCSLGRQSEKVTTDSLMAIPSMPLIWK